MAIDYREMERQFLAGLAADTGRDLAGWMAAIAEAGLTDRNAIIDWLRRQRFTFSRASWLERIHHNGGKPVYGDGPAGLANRARRRATVAELPATPAPARAPLVLVPVQAPPPPQTPKPAVPTAPAPGGDAGDLDALLRSAKALRPLALFVLAEVQKAVPDCRVVAGTSHVAFANRATFGVLGIGPRELKLALDLGAAPLEGAWKKAKLAGLDPDPGAALSHMIALTDARQVDAALLTAVAEAARRTRGG